MKYPLFVFKVAPSHQMEIFWMSTGLKWSCVDLSNVWLWVTFLRLYRLDWVAAVRGADVGLRYRSGGSVCCSPGLQGAAERAAATLWLSRRNQNMWAAAAAVAVKNMAASVTVARLCRLAGRTVSSLPVRERPPVSLLARTCYVATSTENSEWMFL